MEVQAELATRMMSEEFLIEFENFLTSESEIYVTKYQMAQSMKDEKQMDGILKEFSSKFYDQVTQLYSMEEINKFDDDTLHFFQKEITKTAEEYLLMFTAMSNDDISDDELEELERLISELEGLY